MGKKDKTRFEKWFSLSHHQRHTGTKKLSLLILNLRKRKFY
ncbi:hypothetical protein AZO1586I_2069 [Bathymodiolus thermophilus thioautotrophic gill symbiont]|uniref:Uncharacterized protein n=2 Tax=sulfur-oxidizing symbionts TaxID=32036 RepID=A0ACA8ZMY5_9GAMM|nr:hypothetical protein AZO1586R_229 [Bathymodiolus azoricus thioautotrophic gill symbiont]CAB5507794.1 hypothetical protein AZO1586I_2069 [Bathymodiolus thermophilus thioautotrophic gill symbiont]CAC9525088.1 hypothetical protein [uncultured Gammaproteobacteria bacterium]CAC9528703.1 hypothetical protein [uncultured Gammaproteobacteria bacterium]CAC9993675.1 hypothetical protein [uncultured Gammaproteobacteria bacterium]